MESRQIEEPFSRFSPNLKAGKVSALGFGKNTCRFPIRLTLEHYRVPTIPGRSYSTRFNTHPVALLQRIPTRSLLPTRAHCYLNTLADPLTQCISCQLKTQRASKCVFCTPASKPRMPHMKTTKVLRKPLLKENQKGIVVATFVQIKPLWLSI